MKYLILILLITPVILLGQNTTLFIEGAAPDFYLTHKVAAKENYYSIGRLYNISPKEIAPYNKLELEKGLSLNQVIKIPLTSNFTQSGKPEADEAFVPLIHVIKPKETLNITCSLFNNLPITSLKQWNQLKTENIPKGAKLTVGFLKVKKELSTFSSNAISENLLTQSNTVVSAPKELPTTTSKPNETINTTTTPAATPIKEKTEVIANTPATPKETPKKIEPIATVNKSKLGEGYFKNDFLAATENESGKAGIFKSTSGWEDGKYYCLHNSAKAGSIMKVTNKMNGKSVFVKVLDAMPDLNQNANLIIRISNAGADALGASEQLFDCELSFVK
jgi:LysM repeat protein